MKTFAFILPLVTLAANCFASPPATPGQPAPKREKIIELQLKVLKLAVENAQLKKNPELELRVLIDEGIAAPYDEVRSAAFRMLGDLPEVRRRTAVPEVLSRFETGKPPFRVLALEFLGRAPGPEAERAVLGATRDPAPTVRRAAALVLKSSSKEAAIKAILGLLEDADPEVKLAALDGLAVPRRDSAVKPLINFLGRQTDPKILERSAHALGVIGSKVAVEALADLLARTRMDDVRWSCINSLGKIGDPTVAVRLGPCLEATHPVNIRQVTIEALGKLKATDFLPRLAKILGESKEEELRRAAAGAIGRMGTLDAIESILLPTYLAESSESVRREAWTAMLGLAGEGFESNERFALALLKSGRRQEAQEICTRMHAVKTGDALHARHLALEEKVAEAAFDAGDIQAALSHLRVLAAFAPKRREIRRRVATCYRELKDYESALNTLQELAGGETSGTAEWWMTQFELLDLRGLMKDPEPQVELAHMLLKTNPPPHPTDRKKQLEAALRAGAIRLAGVLETATPEAQKASLAKVGPKIIAVLASILEEGDGRPGPLLKVGNALTGTTYDLATTDPATLKEAAAKWRAWLKAQSSP